MNYSSNSNNSINPEDNSFIANPSLKIDHVHLKVSNLQNSIDFYQSILGFRVLGNRSGENMASLVSQELGQDNRSSLLVLNQIDSNNSETGQPSKVKREAGLYHFAILLPERKFLDPFYNTFRIILIHNTMKVWLTTPYLSLYISTTLIIMESKITEIGNHLNGYGQVQIMYTW